MSDARLPGEFVGVTFSPDDTRIVIVDTRGRVTVLDAESLEPLGKAVRVGARGAYVFLGPDGRTGLRLIPGYVPDPTFDHPGRGWVLADMETGRVEGEGQVDSTRRGWRDRPTGSTPRSAAPTARSKSWISCRAKRCSRP